ncbi:SAC3 family protein LENG8/THP3 [Microdochium nivale]|nr:SAC3 family protein LENG8/THP3 [Microdochium nivale]
MRARGGGGRGGEPWRRGTSNANRSHRDQQQQPQQQQQQQQAPLTPAGSSRSIGGRTSSAPWSRLKPIELDPLDALGLPSKGDNRLLDFKTQERYYTKIVERYMAFCSDAGERDELLRRFASLSVDLAGSIDAPPSSSSPAATGAAPTERTAKAGGGMAASRHASATDKPNTATHTFTPTSSSSTSSTAAADPPTPSLSRTNMTGNTSSLGPSSEHAKSLSDVLAALRKLREGIVASKRADDFAIQAYLFCIRLAVLARHPESYHAAMLHLLHRIHPRHNMTSVEAREVVSYLILDTACRRGDLAEAYALRSRHVALFRSSGGGGGGRGVGGSGGDSKVDAVLDALAHDNYVEFGRLRGHVDGHRARLLEYAEPRMRRHALKCFGKTYLSVELGYLERCAGSEWASLAADDGVGWELEGGSTVVIRRVRAK